MRRINRFKMQIGLLFALAVMLAPTVVLAGRGFYVVDASVRTGMLVSLTKNPDVVEPASIKNMSSLVGVVGTAQTDFSIKSGQVSVQTDGVVNALVSTVAGDILVGDHISPSSIVGFGAKSDGSSWIVGTAQASLSADTPSAVKTTVTDTAGAKHEVYVASMPVLVKVVQENTAAKTAVEQSSKLPNKVQAFADSVAGKKASQVAVMLSFLILLAGFVVAGIIVNAAVKNGIISTARQPLARQAIMGRMAQSLIIAVVILVAAVIGSLVLIRVI